MSKVKNGTQRKKILVVDNHPVMLEFMTKFLTARGYHVLTAFDGISALNTLKDFIPDVMFIDLIMPNIDGEKLCRIIRSSQRLTDVSIVVISAVAAEEEINIKAIGADACIAKGPFNKMNKHILTVLEQLDRKGAVSNRKKPFGAEDIRSRAVTKELLSAKRHFELIIDNITEGILELNHEGKVIYVNPAAAKWVGSIEEKLLSKDFIDLFDEADRPRAKKLLATVQKNLKPIHNRTPFTKRKKHFLLSILPVKDSEFQSIIVIFKQVTKQSRRL